MMTTDDKQPDQPILVITIAAEETFHERNLSKKFLIRKLPEYQVIR